MNLPQNHMIPHHSTLYVVVAADAYVLLADHCVIVHVRETATFSTVIGISCFTLNSRSGYVPSDLPEWHQSS